MRGFRSGFAILVVAVALLLALGIAWEAIDTGHYQESGAPTPGGWPMMPWMLWGGGMWEFPAGGRRVPGFPSGYAKRPQRAICPTWKLKCVTG